MRIALLALGDTGEALLLRALLENLGAKVDLHPIGKPSAFFSTLAEPTDIAILSAHGDEAGFVFPEISPGVDDLILPTNRIIAKVLRQNLKSAPKIVLSTACDSGHAPIASAFHSAGTECYIAPADYPKGASVPLLLGLVFHHVVAGLSWSDAMTRANSQFPTDDHFALFDGLGPQASD